jgi:hypothetical protein
MRAGDPVRILCMVPKARFELARARLTTPSRWRVYQFHHSGKNYLKPTASLLLQALLLYQEPQADLLQPASADQ